MGLFQEMNNIWVLVIAVILLYAIIKKIYNLNKPFDENKFIEQYHNQQKIKKKLNFENIPAELPKLASFYVGLN